ncbi:conserved hypothetical protein [Vibrio nigripulchritudo SFn27]|uniref:Uncharacterized protein n=2 Tax=Vibrio nigripulchritudo TaxID=28173 RepID=U4K9H8_9VIBR|nr:hypothetical protein [Vibrio nigripulchritudo]CCN63540.1 conserved hypothetical protein [Vibrio nigripulchritudo POn4]CCN71233.1 conserved hypothetical protein [Vibrio nigripulchritudo SFn118]CCN82208.1 conserved hypothetical protein [Vibrio nigripulchritudo BLFn1]CCN91765.1 conserved hypothetical protein [Vibrio nigripulchritudo SFn27]CCN97370.1 conserved hypothetical protein [Vibrio nigripulchritudo ENn2]
MISKAITQSVSLFMLLVVAVCMTSSAIGEYRSHGLSTMYSVDIHHTHSSSSSHSHGHSHGVDGEHLLQHDASNHNHAYDSASLRSVNQPSLVDLIKSPYVKQVVGTPIYNPFKIERPPRTLLTV